MQQASIYIPLCFYFIMARTLKPEGRSSYLHSTMLLLYLLRLRCLCPSTEYLHSTMLLLYPLCPFPRSSFVTNLHSTMLLLYRKPGCTYAESKTIYIPLCFYFILPFRMYGKVFNDIYIPLCFYFIYNHSYSQGVRKQIYIPLCFYFIEPITPSIKVLI